MTESLFERVGRQEGVDRIVEDFYRRVEADPEIRPVYPADLEPGKAKLKLFLAQWLGGPATYTEQFGHPRLRRRHFPFVIEEKHAGRWLRHMRGAMEAEGVPAADLKLIFERLGPLAHHMVNAHEDVPREPLSNHYLT